MTERLQLTATLEQGTTDESLRRLAADALARSPDELGPVHLVRKSLDARRGKVRWQLVVEVDPPGSPGQRPSPSRPQPREVQGSPPVVIVGAGPGGLFCAWELACQGIASVVLDRGKKVQPRRKDLKLVNRRGQVDEDSNYCFGEGGAGTYSDGKLYTRAHKRGDVGAVLATLVDCGADRRILVDGRPHIGSNRLPEVVTGLRERLEAVGVRFHFGAKVTDLFVEDAPSGRRVRGVELADSQRIDASAVVLATGHSARDVLEMLERAGAQLEPKPFAVGLRIEHPQPLVDRIQYGRHAGHPELPPAAYRLAHDEGDASVFSFCMCPGGFIVPSVTAAGEVVVNGMSPRMRGSRFANSGLVASIEAPTWRAGLELQAGLEGAAFDAGGGGFAAPAARVPDFLAGVVSADLPVCSYQPGVKAADVGTLLDGAAPGLADRMRRALLKFDENMKGYVTDEAMLVGVESRTSSPVRVPRDRESLEQTQIGGLYPCGEGAGYAGGIVSAALDGQRIARRIATTMQSR